MGLNLNHLKSPYSYGFSDFPMKNPGTFLWNGVSTKHVSDRRSWSSGLWPFPRKHGSNDSRMGHVFPVFPVFPVSPNRSKAVHLGSRLAPPVEKTNRLNQLSFINYTSSTAQGGGGSFKNRKPIGEVGCCESGMAERSHWWSDRWLISLTISLSFSDYLPTYLPTYLSLSLSFICLAVYLSICLPNYLSTCLSVVQCHWV